MQKYVIALYIRLSIEDYPCSLTSITLLIVNFRCCGYHHYGEYLDYIKLLVAAVTQTAQRPLDHRTSGRWPPPYAFFWN